MKTLTLLQDYANSSDNIWLANNLQILQIEIETAILQAQIDITGLNSEDKEHCFTMINKGQIDLTDEITENINPKEISNLPDIGTKEFNNMCLNMFGGNGS
jgi:hypothetical protein